MNYDEEMQKEINDLTSVPSLLLHSCCAPCSSYVISLLANYFNITIFYYNPNIDDYTEYNKRKSEQKRFIKEFKSINKIEFLDCDYDNETYLEKVKGYELEPERGNRCPICFRLRLEKAASTAQNKYDYFATTLTVSPYKNSKQINEIGLELAEKYNVKYLVSDFKKRDGYKKSIELSHKYNLYRQNYCGCKFSKKN